MAQLKVKWRSFGGTFSRGDMHMTSEGVQNPESWWSWLDINVPAWLSFGRYSPPTKHIN
jgi:hypothetical protein